MKNLAFADKYLYIIKRPFYIRLLGFAGFISSLLLFYGLTRYFNLNIWYWIVFSPLAIFFLFNRLIRFGQQMFYPRFDIPTHEKFIADFWQVNGEPSVDIFIPYAGEDIATYEDVVRSAANLDYANKKVYLLNDSMQEITDLAEKYGAIHLSREEKGKYKKSGNLQHGYDNSNGEFVLVLDADFRIAPFALHELIPYIATDTSIGILQTPQYFPQHEEVHNRSCVEFGGGNVVEDFYRIDLPSRDRFQAAICVGTSAIYRRAAVLGAGGTPKVWGTEDVKQGLKVSRVGYRVKYLPLIVSIGESPETIQGYFRQHNRWCTGSLTTIFGEYWAQAKIPLFARVSYLTNVTYYFAEASSVVLSFHLLTLLLFNSQNLRLINSIWFLPYLLYYHFIMPVTRIAKPKHGTYIAAFSNIFAYTYTFLALPFNKVLPWQPAGLKTKSVDTPFLKTFIIACLITFVFTASFVAIMATHLFLLRNINAYPPILWSMYIIFWYTIYLHHSVRFLRSMGNKEI